MTGYSTIHATKGHRHGNTINRTHDMIDVCRVSIWALGRDRRGKEGPRPRWPPQTLMDLFNSEDSDSRMALSGSQRGRNKEPRGSFRDMRPYERPLEGPARC